VISVSLPARVNVLGNPTDGVEGAYATVSAAIEVRGGASAAAADEIVFERENGRRGVFPRARIADARGFDVEAAAVNSLLRHSHDFAAALARGGVRLQTWTQVPASSGLAGSSVLVLAVLAALRAHYRLDRWRLNDYLLAEVGQRAEEHEMGIVCGFADRYVPVLGDIAYLSYHGKLWHAPLGEEPLVTYEKLGGRVPALRFVVATTGVERHSGSVHAPMRARYLDERRRGAGPMLDLARRLGETAWRGKLALLAGDLVTFGGLLRRNQELIDEMMRLCGFAAGAGEEVALLVRAAADAGALGAKLTGAGGGGSIFAVAPPGGEERLADALRQAAAGAGLGAARVFAAPVASRGLIVEDGKGANPEPPENP
jgi:galactokinase/mevalonate kinase-like predicted kinase